MVVEIIWEMYDAQLNHGIPSYILDGYVDTVGTVVLVCTCIRVICGSDIFLRWK
jgi:hypothetical protein